MDRALCYTAHIAPELWVDLRVQLSLAGISGGGGGGGGGVVSHARAGSAVPFELASSFAIDTIGPKTESETDSLAAKKRTGITNSIVRNNNNSISNSNTRRQATKQIQHNALAACRALEWSWKEDARGSQSQSQSQSQHRAVQQRNRSLLKIATRLVIWAVHRREGGGVSI